MLNMINYEVVCFLFGIFEILLNYLFIVYLWC